MQQVTSDFKRDILKPERKFDCKVMVGAHTFTKTEVAKIEFESGIQPGDSFTLGTVVSKSIKMTLLTNIPITEEMVIDIRLALWVERKVDGVILHEWEWLPMGRYFIDELEGSGTGVVSMTAYDSIIKTETSFDLSITTSTTLRDAASWITTKTGLAFADTIPAYSIKALEGVYSIREVLGLIAGLMGGSMVVTRDNQYKVIKPQSTGVAIDGNQYFKFVPELTEYAIGKITCDLDKEKSISAGVLELGTKEMQMVNPWMTESILKNILKSFEGFSFAGYTLTGQGNPAMDAGDCLQVTDTKGIKHDIPVLWLKLKFSGGLTMELSAKGQTAVKNEFNAKGEASKELSRVVAQQGIFNELTTEIITAHSGYFDQIKGGTGEFGEIFVRYLEFDQMVGNNLTVKNAKIDIANIESLLAGNITAGNIQSITLNALNSTVERSFVTDQIAKNLYVSDLLAGDISTNRFRIVSDDGGIIIKGATQQWKDKNNVVRMQAGKDAQGNFTFALFDTTGKGILIDSTGIHEKAVPDGLIVNDMIAGGANIGGEKINIKSLITEVNGSTETIKSSKILYDPTGQSLEIAFGTLKKNYNDFTTVTYDGFVKATNQSLEARYAETHMTVSGKEVLLRDRYTQVVESAGGLMVKVNDHESTLYQDGTGLVSKMATTELAIKPGNILAKVTEAITGTNPGSVSKLKTSSIELTKDDFIVTGANFKVRNNSGIDVLTGDTDGNLVFSGELSQRSADTNKTGIKISNGRINMRAYQNGDVDAGTFVGYGGGGSGDYGYIGTNFRLPKAGQFGFTDPDGYYVMQIQPYTVIIDRGLTCNGQAVLNGTTYVGDDKFYAYNITCRANNMGIYAAGKVEFQRASGQAYIPIVAANVAASSLEKYKTKIDKFINGIDVIRNTEVYSYLLKNDIACYRPKKKIGLVIGENYNTPDIFKTYENDSIELYSCIGVLMQAVKELDGEVEELKNRRKP